MADLSTLIQFGGMGVMAFMVIAMARIAGPILTALSDRLLDSIERQTLTIDRLGDIAASMDKRLVVVEQQNDMLQDLIHAVIWPLRDVLPDDPAPRPSRANRVPTAPIDWEVGQERRVGDRRAGTERRQGDRRVTEHAAAGEPTGGR